jgi:hypothetical protein
MNNCPRGRGHGPRRPWPRRARVATVITVMATAALLPACGGSPAPTGSGSSATAGGSANSSSAVAYSRCVRSHGAPDFPDPDSSGQIPKEAVVRAFREVGDSRAKAATYACANLNPNANGQGSQPLTVQEQQDYLRAAACMRSHGITNFPDPTFPGGHASLPHIPSSIDTSSTQFTQARRTCEKLIPAGLLHGGSGGGS